MGSARSCCSAGAAPRTTTPAGLRADWRGRSGPGIHAGLFAGQVVPHRASRRDRDASRRIRWPAAQLRSRGARRPHGAHRRAGPADRRLRRESRADPPGRRLSNPLQGPHGGVERRHDQERDRAARGEGRRPAGARSLVAALARLARAGCREGGPDQPRARVPRHPQLPHDPGAGGRDRARRRRRIPAARSHRARAADPGIRGRIPRAGRRYLSRADYDRRRRRLRQPAGWVRSPSSSATGTDPGSGRCTEERGMSPICSSGDRGTSRAGPSC